MSKSTKISALKPSLKHAMSKLTMGNAGVYGGQAAENASPLSGLMSAIKMKANHFQNGTLTNGVSNQDWILMGEQLHQSILEHQGENKINAVCDTCSGLVIYLLHRQINFRGRIELFAETTIHHHYVVIDRDPESDRDDYTTWGKDAFVVDIWQASSFHDSTRRGIFNTAHHYKHGIYRKPKEHVYTLNEDGDYKFQIDATWTI